MLILRIDDVARPVDSPAWEGVDSGLGFFQDWRSAAGLAGTPVVYGTIPARLTNRELDVLADLAPPESIACHGWCHGKGEPVTEIEMSRGIDRLDGATLRRTVSYIPPFNDYNHETIERWGAVGGRYFFGGRQGADHDLGHLPVRCGPVVHIPAFEPLYGRAPELVALDSTIRRLGASAAPFVATLHTVWDDRCLPAVGEAVSIMRPYLRPVECVDLWLEACDNSRARFAASGAQSLPIETMRGLIRPGCAMLDFGAGSGEWPHHAALHGAHVTVCDRDDAVLLQGNRFAAFAPTALSRIVVSPDLGWLTPSSFDLITAMWSIQHNLRFEAQRGIVERLAAALRPGATLVITGSLAPGQTYLWSDRKDPMLRLDLADWHRLLHLVPLCGSPTIETFRYQHLEAEAAFAPADQSNAVIARITKDS